MVVPNSSVLPGDFEIVDFQIEKEDWNTYELKDGTILKGRVILTRVGKDKNRPPDQYGIQTENLFVTWAPKDKKGPPSTPPPMDQIPESQMIQVEPERSNEIWNIYRIPSSGHRLRVKLVAHDILRVKDVFDQIGEPYFIITSAVMSIPMPKTTASI
jgi:hypothetical protein